MPIIQYLGELIIFGKSLKSAAVLLTLIWACGLNSQSALQYFSKSGESGLDTMAINKTSNLAAESSGLLYEAISPTDYIVGPGDEFVVSIITSNRNPVEYKTTVSPEGRLILRGAGVIDTRAMTLEELYSSATEKLREIYTNTQIDIVLVGIREFKVTVAGKVVGQGVAPSYATERVYEAILKTGGLTDKASIRNIQLVRDGVTQRVDIPRYTYLDDKSANPYLQGGDLVYVPAFDDKRIISIEGEVLNPGIYEFIEGDRIKDLIAFSKGFTSIALKDSVELYRYESQTGAVDRFVFDLSDQTGASEIYDMVLKEGDRLYVRQSQYYEGDYAVITGEVYKPGRYQINDDMNQLSELFEISGGLKPDANVKNAVFYRRKNSVFYDSEMDRLSRVSTSEMNDLEKQYYYSRINEVYGAVSLDIPKLLTSKEDYRISHMDSVHVPGQNTYVNVQGRVRNPGLVKHVPDADYYYYINEAGGLSSDADKSEIIISKIDGSKFYADESGYKIETGDNILVPPEEPIDAERLITNIIAISAQLLAIISIGLTLSRN